MIRFTCECGKLLQARDESAGKLVVCPACKRQTRIPEQPQVGIQPEEPPLPRARETAAPRRPPALRDDAEEEQGPRGSSGKAIASLVLGIVSLCGCACLTGLPSILLGILALRDISRAGGLLTGKVLAIVGMALGGVGTFCLPLVGIPAWFYSQEAAQKATDANNLKQMALALTNYSDVHNGRLPPAGLGDPRTDREGRKPLLSWRVAILPYIEQQNLYMQFKLDEPWDSPNNKPLLARMPKIYQLPGDTKTPSDHTVYQVLVGPGTAFEKGQQVHFPASIPDGTSNTILIAESAKGVPWTKPEDLPFDPQAPLPPLGGHFRGGFNVALADGSVRFITPSISEKTLKAAITRNGGELLGPDW